MVHLAQREDASVSPRVAQRDERTYVETITKLLDWIIVGRVLADRASPRPSGCVLTTRGAEKATRRGSAVRALSRPSLK